VARGNTVRVVDDLSTGKRENLPAKVELIVGDVTDRDVMRAAVKGIAGCFHLAAVASVQAGLTDWVGTHRTNLTGTITLFDALRDWLRVPVVYASSAAVYGNCPPPINEDAPKRPLSAYGADKYACELHAAVANHVHCIPTIGLRFFNVYGPRQDPASPYSGVISIFYERLRRGEPIDIHGDGEQTRDFIHVADVVNALLAAIDHAREGAMVFNVCTGHGTSVRNLANYVAALCQRGLAIRYLPAREGDIRHSCGSSAKLRNTYYALPEPMPLHAGLMKMWTER
jgi:UDP-glucose 4-epimerase